MTVYVRFSNCPFGVTRFQNLFSIDAARGLSAIVILSGLSRSISSAASAIAGPLGRNAFDEIGFGRSSYDITHRPRVPSSCCNGI